MSAAPMIRVLRARETYGFVQGKLDVTREVVGWSLSVFLVSFAATIAFSAACIAFPEFRAAAMVFCAATNTVLWFMRRMEQRADVLHRSLEEAWSECERAISALEREQRAAMAQRTEGER